MIRENSVASPSDSAPMEVRKDPLLCAFYDLLKDAGSGGLSLTELRKTAIKNRLVSTDVVIARKQVEQAVSSSLHFVKVGQQYVLLSILRDQLEAHKAALEGPDARSAELTNESRDHLCKVREESPWSGEARGGENADVAGIGPNGGLQNDLSRGGQQISSNAGSEEDEISIDVLKPGETMDVQATDDQSAQQFGRSAIDYFSTKPPDSQRFCQDEGKISCPPREEGNAGARMQGEESGGSMLRLFRQRIAIDLNVPPEEEEVSPREETWSQVNQISLRNQVKLS
jgi:hypothetical protein